MWKYTYTDTLYHHGIIGMKWGHRRYQNKDGSLTPAGQKRYDRDVRENEAKKKENRITIDKPDPKRWVKEDLNRAKGLSDSASSAVNKSKNFVDSRPVKKEKLDLTNMTDQQLRERINRTQLERQYNDMFAPEKVNKGREVVSTALKVAGGVLTATSTALGIALAIKDLKG